MSSKAVSRLTIPERRIVLPTLHLDQAHAFRASRRTKRFVLRCGRRWGKTILAIWIGAQALCRGEKVGWFVPQFSTAREVYKTLLQILEPIVSSRDGTKMRIETITGGVFEVWSFENMSVRGRFYHIAFIDEAGFTASDAYEIWEGAIEPTLYDYDGTAFAMSNANGIDEENFLYRICKEERLGWTQYWAPTRNNPTLPIRAPGETDESHAARRHAAIEKLRADKDPLVFLQEYEAKFIDRRGQAYFSLRSLFQNPAFGALEGLPWPTPEPVDGVFAVIDSAVKDGREHDGCAVVYCSISRYQPDGPKLMILDWDVIKITSAMLIHWIPNVYSRLEELARETKAIRGAIGVWVEDKAGGQVLLQQVGNARMPVNAISNKLTSLGKSARALNVSGYVFSRDVGITRAAHDKVTVYNERSGNHLIRQVTGFRIGEKEMKEDDLLDCFCYAIAYGIGNAEGY